MDACKMGCCLWCCQCWCCITNSRTRHWRTVAYKRAIGPLAGLKQEIKELIASVATQRPYPKHISCKSVAILLTQASMQIKRLAECMQHATLYIHPYEASTYTYKKNFETHRSTNINRKLKSNLWSSALYCGFQFLSMLSCSSCNFWHSTF